MKHHNPCHHPSEHAIQRCTCKVCMLPSNSKVVVRDRHAKQVAYQEVRCFVAQHSVSVVWKDLRVM